MKLLIFFMTFLTAVFLGAREAEHVSAYSPQQEKLTQYLSTLVSMPTETADKEENSKALYWVENELSTLGLYFKHEAFGGHPTLVVTTKKTMTPDLFLVAHIDVVPASTSLYQPHIEGNKMYGRGVYDMKMAIACYLLLLHELKDQLPQMNIGLMLTSDEEMGGMNGVKRLLEAGYSSKVAFLPDGGFGWKFEESAKGVLQIKISTKGLAAHSSRPWLGKNGIEMLMKALRKVQGHFKKEKIHYGPYFPTVNIGMISGGKSANQVPDYAEAKLDIRYPPDMEGNAIYSTLVELLRKDPAISVEITAEGSPYQANLQLAPFIRFQEIAKKQYGIEIGKVHSHGASDARFFGEKNIPVLVIAPQGGDIHSDNEWIDLEDLTRFYNVLKQWIVQIISDRC